MSKAHKANSISSLRGIEGSTAVLFFDILNKSLPDGWKFDNRTKNPPQDPVNTMLSFGYSILYHHISTALQTEGLNPQIGLFHHSSSRYFPLASDIQEEFRHIIDILVVHIIRKKMVSFNDFVLDRRNLYPCLMSKDFIKKFISIIEERLNIKFKPQGLSKEMSYKQFFHHQARLMKSSIQNGRMIYLPLNIR